MMHSGLSVSLIIIIYSSVFLVKSKDGLEKYCTKKTLAGVIDISNIEPDVLPYLRVCSDVDGYVDCVQNKRQTKAVERLDVLETEIAFPNLTSLRLAYYYFCIKSFEAVQYSFLKSTTTKCDMAMVNSVCKTMIKTDRLKSFQSAVTNRNLEEIESAGCDAIIDYFKCKRKLCKKAWSNLMELELMKLGTDCLVKHQTETLITPRFCVETHATAISASTKGVMLSFLLVEVTTA